MRGISKSPVPACGTGLLPRRSTVPALGSSRNLPDSDLLNLPDQSDCLNGEVETHGTSTLNKCQTPPRHARRGFRGRRWVRVAVPIRVHCSAHGTRVLRQDQDSGGLPYPASDLGSRNPSSNPDSNPDSNLDRNPHPAPSSKSAPCVAGRGLAFVDGRSAMRFNLSIQAIGLIGQIEKIQKIETIGIRKISGRSESRYC